MPLVTLGDLTAASRSDPTRAVYEVALARVQERARPMPPDPSQRLRADEIAALQGWAQQGAHSGAPCSARADDRDAGAAEVHDVLPTAAHAGGAGAGGTAEPHGAAGSRVMSAAQGGGGGVSGMSGTGGNVAQPAAAGQGGSSTPAQPASDIESCYALQAHGQAAPGDMSAYSVPTGETYTSFIFKAPWTQPVQGLRFRHLPDDVAVLHHWILYSESAPVSDGDIEPCGLSGLFGFLCGQGTTRSMITGWAPGRGDFTLPDGIGLELPKPGAMLALELHYNNSGAASALDRSGVEVCVTSKLRPNTASISWLGTESIHIPANAPGTATGACKPRRAGLNASDPIHILYSWPHMHKLGTHLTSLVNRAAGGVETLYDGDFSFEFQVLHDTPFLLQPGDSVSTTCTYQNTTNAAVSFGQSTSEEMCFNFVYAWPAHALDNSGASFGEASNTCLQ